MTYMYRRQEHNQNLTFIEVDTYMTGCKVCLEYLWFHGAWCHGMLELSRSMLASSCATVAREEFLLFIFQEFPLNLLSIIRVGVGTRGHYTGSFLHTKQREAV